MMRIAPSPAAPFAAFRAEVLALYQADRAPKTFLRVRQVLREVEHHGVELAGDLTPLAVSAWIGGMPPRSPLTKRALVSTLRTVCRFAVGRGYLARSPFDAWTFRVKGGRAAKRRHHPADRLAAALEFLRAEAAIGDWKARRLYALASTVAYTGLRKLEALRLRWEDVDLVAGTLDVSPRARLKTEASARTIGLPDALTAALAAWRLQVDTAWCFPNVPGTGPWLEGSPGNKPLDALKAAGTRAGVDGLTFLSLRHSWATIALQVHGLPPALVAKNLGHTSIKTAFEHYAGDDLESLRRAVRPFRFDR
jgi:integrase